MKESPWTKAALLEMSGSYWETCALHTAVKLELFTAIGGGKMDADTMAKRIGGNTYGVERLLGALCAMDLLTKEKGLYANTEFSLKYLAKESPDYTGFIIKHHHHLMDSWNRMSESVLSGDPCRKRPATLSETERESFLMGMFNLAMELAPHFAREIDLSGRERFLDFGGGPGTYAIHFCRENPGMTATVFDLPDTRPFAERTIARFGLADRIDFKEGSYIDDAVDLEKEYDVAWISHNLHGEGPEEAEKVVAHAVSVLKPGGLIFIHEFILNDDKTGPLFPALFSINMLLGTPGGRAYSERELMAILEKSGVVDVKRLDVKAAVTSGIVCGRVEG
ncbi:MAG: methyltransferase domain-containing protein [Deltaproteobacteria bacterium]|nr:methyltransferase domain-containing protein [Deltaproteobacteria bacterium]